MLPSTSFYKICKTFITSYMMKTMNVMVKPSGGWLLHRSCRRKLATSHPSSLAVTLPFQLLHQHLHLSLYHWVYNCKNGYGDDGIRFINNSTTAGAAMLGLHHQLYPQISMTISYQMRITPGILLPSWEPETRGIIRSCRRSTHELPSTLHHPAGHWVSCHSDRPPITSLCFLWKCFYFQEGSPKIIKA